MGAGAGALAADEVAVGGRDAALAWRHPLAVGGETHRAAGLAPFEARLGEHAVQALGFCLGLDAHRAGHDPGGDMIGLVPALHDLGGGAQVGDAGVGAGADEHPVDLGAFDRLAGFEALVLECGFPGATLLLRSRARIGDGAVDGDHVFRAGAPGDLRRDVLHVDRVLAIELGIGIARQGAPVSDGAIPHRALRRIVAAVEIFVGRVVGRDHAGARAHLDGEVAEREPRLGRQGAHARAGIFDRVAGAGGGAEFADQVKDHVLGRDARQ